MTTRSAAGAMLACLALGSGCLSYHRGAMPGEPAGATFASIDGVRVRYVDIGEGSPVVLLHGFASAIEAWDAVIPRLARHRRVIALDLKGFGWTDRPPGDYSPPAQARLVWKLLDQRGVDRTAIVGHSWGASVALAMALERPERTERLALYDAWVYEDQLPAFFVWARASGLGEVLFSLYYKERQEDRIVLAFHDPALVSQAMVDAIERAMDRPGTTAAALAAVRGQRYARWQRRYREIKAPVLLLWGREDRVTPVTIGERLLRDLPDARLEVYPRCGHMPMIEAAAQSTADLIEFLTPAPPPAPVLPDPTPPPGEEDA